MLSAFRAFEANGLDFPKTFDYFFDHQYVVKGPGYFMLFMEDVNDKDAWLVYWAECHRSDMLGTFLRHMPFYKPKVAWCRPFKGRKGPKYYSTDRLLSLIREALPPR